MTAIGARRNASAVGAGRRRLAGAASSYGLLVLGGVLILAFSLALPDTFPTGLTVRSILNNQTTTLLLALALTVVIATKEFDLSIGYVVGLTHVLAIGFIVKNGMSWPVSVLLVVLISIAIGTGNGLLVHYAHIDSFIATLGTGTVA
jgi:ribose transport system permease protein